MDSNINVDPHYQLNNTAIKRAQEKKSKDDLEKLTHLIDEEFTKEITNRQTQIDQIEEQLFRAQKLLHLVRYVLITSYYDEKALEYNGIEETSYSGLSFHSQNRIHPAIKKLLGKNADVKQILTANTKRKIHHKHSTEHQNVKSDSKSTSSNVEEEDEVCRKKQKLDVCDNIEFQSEPSSSQINFEMNRGKKVKHRIVVGNISKFISKTDQVEDNLTHKWMVYVRGPKEMPDIGHFVEECKFYLHPSYKPHDVVEVNEPPFHLTRLGWGEFRIRVRISFKNPLNKPIDIIHNLKLDKTYTGRQTLGNETIVDVYLHDNLDPTIKQEDDLIENETFDECNNWEHNYFVEPYSTLNTSVLEDHDYCSTNESTTKIHDNNYEFVQDNNNPLIYGLDDSYNAKNHLNQPTYFLAPNYNKVMLSNGNIVNVNKFQENALPHLELINNQIRYLIYLPINYFKSIGEMLPYLFKRLPLYHANANYLPYKCLYPFTATSLEEYKTWHLPKRFSSEWSRARTIKKLLQKYNIPGNEKWSTKAILLYGRSHFYTPLTSFSIFRKAHLEKQLLSTCYELKINNSNNMAFNRLNGNCDVNIDIENDVDNSHNERNQSSNFIENFEEDEKFSSIYSFIRHTALDCGIVLKSELLDKNIQFRGAERMILESVKCFAENLIRRAANHLVCNTNFHTEHGEITSSHINVALNERPEMLSLDRFKKKKRDMEYFL